MARTFLMETRKCEMCGTEFTTRRRPSRPTMRCKKCQFHLDLRGKRFGRLTVIGYAGDEKWLCRCECGTEKLVDGDPMRRGVVLSCGCLRLERAVAAASTHRKSKTRTYYIWAVMRDRCSNKNCEHYKDYGGRGIKVCERWQRFENFLADMGEAPPGLTIDRIKNDGDYELSNCRWATRKQQMRNTRNNRMIEFRGETKCVAEWADAVGLPQRLVYARITKLGWTPERALTTPPIRP